MPFYEWIGRKPSSEDASGPTVAASKQRAERTLRTEGSYVSSLTGPDGGAASHSHPAEDAIQESWAQKVLSWAVLIIVSLSMLWGFAYTRMHSRFERLAEKLRQVQAAEAYYLPLSRYWRQITGDSEGSAGLPPEGLRAEFSPLSPWTWLAGEDRIRTRIEAGEHWVSRARAEKDALPALREELRSITVQWDKLQSFFLPALDEQDAALGSLSSAVLRCSMEAVVADQSSSRTAVRGKIPSSALIPSEGSPAPSLRSREITLEILCSPQGLLCLLARLKDRKCTWTVDELTLEEPDAGRAEGTASPASSAIGLQDAYPDPDALRIRMLVRNHFVAELDRTPSGLAEYRSAVSVMTELRGAGLRISQLMAHALGPDCASRIRMVQVRRQGRTFHIVGRWIAGPEPDLVRKAWSEVGEVVVASSAGGGEEGADPKSFAVLVR